MKFEKLMNKDVVNKMKGMRADIIKVSAKVCIIISILYIGLNFITLKEKRIDFKLIKVYELDRKQNEYYMERVSKETLWGYTDTIIFTDPDSLKIRLPQCLKNDNYYYYLNSHEIKKIWFIPLYHNIGKNHHWAASEESKNNEKENKLYLYELPMKKTSFINIGKPNMSHKIELFILQLIKR